MCFSATASFALSSVLVPTGLWCVQKAWRGDRRFLPLAGFPLGFGTQQAIEGLVWLGMGTQNIALLSGATIGFVFFSHGFWLFWTPFMVSMLEEQPWLRQCWRVIAAIGLAYGVYLLLPLLVHPDWLSVGLMRRSLNYSLHVMLIHPAIAYLGRALYILTILAPLLLTSTRFLRGLGWLILGSLVLTSYLFRYGFISIWCYFAAVVSVYVGYLFFQGVETIPETVRMRES